MNSVGSSRSIACALLPLKKTVKNAISKARYQFKDGHPFGLLRVAGVTIVKRKPIKCGRLVGYHYTPVICSCGNPEIFEVRTTNLQSGHSQSCGCWSRENG